MEKQDGSSLHKNKIRYDDLFEFEKDDKDITDEMYKLISAIFKFSSEIDKTYTEE